MESASSVPCVAIACGGTGGHLFPGRAVGEALVQRGCSISLFLSPKEVDRQLLADLAAWQTTELPAVGLEARHPLRFLRGVWASYRLAARQFRQHLPQAVLAMGGFTSAGPALAARRCRVPVFLHESNTIPGRANRWLAPLARQVFVGFPQAASRLRIRRVTCTGTPVRAEFRFRDAKADRASLGLDPERPVLVVMGGSQGARAVNRLLIEALPRLTQEVPELQYVHLTGPAEVEATRTAYASAQRSAAVHAFFGDMACVLSAGSLAVSRAGASSLAELAAMRLPSVLIPLPQAADNHQWHNARAYADTGAARLLEQQRATPERLVPMVRELVRDGAAAERVRQALRSWHRPNAAGDIAGEILRCSIGAGWQGAAAGGAEAKEAPDPWRGRGNVGVTVARTR